MNRFTSREIARLAPGEMGIAEFAMQVVNIMVSDRIHAGRPPRQDVLAMLVRAVLTGETTALNELLDAFRRFRIPADVAIDVYIPAAVDEIGSAWHDDMIDILDTTVAMARLQNLLRELGRAWRADDAPRGGLPLSVMMVVPVGEQHTLGAMIATSQLRRAGVSVCVRLAPGEDVVDEALSARRFDALFLSIANFESLEHGRKIVKNLRERAGGAGFTVVAGGSVPMDAATVRAAIGADIVTQDVREALTYLRSRVSAPAMD
jgi:MerR family transcriptional regulator, light-induced transcriptional regulator